MGRRRGRLGLCTSGSFRSHLLSWVTGFRLSRPALTVQMLDLSMVDAPAPSWPLAAHHLDAHNRPHSGKKEAREAFDPTESIVSQMHKPSSVVSHSSLTLPERSGPVLRCIRSTCRRRAEWRSTSGGSARL